MGIRWQASRILSNNYASQRNNSQAIAAYLCDFLEFKSIDITKIRGIGFDGTNTMSDQRSGVKKRLRLHAPSAVYVHCRCHQLQLATPSIDEHREVKRVVGTLLNICDRICENVHV